MAEKMIITKDTPPEAIEHDIALTRMELTETIDQIQERFSAQHWKGMAMDTITVAVSRGKELVSRAKDSARRFGRAASDRSMKAKQDLVQFKNDDPEAVRIASFVLGAFAVLALKNLIDKRRWMKAKNESIPDYATAKIMSMEEVEEKVKEAALAPIGETKKAA